MLAASHTERAPLGATGEHAAAATAFTVVAIVLCEVAERLIWRLRSGRPPALHQPQDWPSRAFAGGPTSVTERSEGNPRRGLTDGGTTATSATERAIAG